MSLILTVDFGSTYTKVVAFDLELEAVVGVSQAGSTVDSDVNIGLQEALDRLYIEGEPVSRLPVEKTLACSSAAGGLRVMVSGLVPVLSLEAARRAALGAGAKIVCSFAHKLSDGELQAIEAGGCDIFILAGGTDGGDEETVLHNARCLASSNLSVPVIVAGNKVASDRSCDILREKGKMVLLTENILPALETLNTDPLHGVIRDVFMSHIIHAKGIDRAQKFVSGGIIPTPTAVLKGAQLLAEGTEGETGMGELVLVDVGGATTDVHSVSSGTATKANVVKGLPEPYLKRTVEGDLGLRVNAATLLGRAGGELIRGYALALAPQLETGVEEFANRVAADTSYVPTAGDELALDAAFSRAAVDLAMERHAGTLNEVYTSIGPVQVQYGKDLTAVRAIIGVGGVFAHGKYPRAVLEGAVFSSRRPLSLRPKEPRCYVDKNYILYGVGLLHDVDPAKALRIGKKGLQPI